MECCLCLDLHVQCCRLQTYSSTTDYAFLLFISFYVYMLMHPCISDSVHSLCRDDANTPINKCNSSELSNTAAISHFRHVTWPTSVSIHNNTLKGGKIHCYNDRRKIAKTVISHLLLYSLAQNWYKYLP